MSPDPIEERLEKTAAAIHEYMERKSRFTEAQRKAADEIKQAKANAVPSSVHTNPTRRGATE